MNICKVWDAEYPWDVRVEKVCRALTSAGHDVHLTARNREGAPTTEQLAEATVHRMRPWSWLGETLDAASQFPAFFNPRWAAHIRTTAEEAAAEVILCRDLPLAPTAYWVGRRLDLPVVLDMAENYPAMIRDLWTTGSRRPWDVLVRNPSLVSLVERWTLPRMDHVLVVVEESRRRLVEIGVSPDRITLVSNTPPSDRVEQLADVGRPGVGASPSHSMAEERFSVATGDAGGTGREAALGEPAGEALDVVYLGLMERARGVELLIEAAALCRRRGIPVRLSLIGDGRDLDAFEEEARRLGLGGDEAQFHGYIDNSEALQRVARSDVGVIPHHGNESWETTIPNKLFDYMSAGVPIVASDVTPVERVLDETGAGVVFADRDPSALADALEQLHAKSPDGRRDMAEAGRRAIRERYNWERDSKRLLEALQATSGSRGSERQDHPTGPRPVGANG